MTSPSALVETVSIDYVDFNDSFLTCSTCLSIYDGSDRSPKLLPCSHTVCRSCLESIANNHRADVNSFRCPICRESITLPQGGVSAFPPSFLVNQLLDLMARQRREIVPKCATHMSQELLFCETCDVIFCIMCAGSAHGGTHTVIPFSIAIKRMSEILLYKAHLCVKNLNTAHENVNLEMTRLEANVETITDLVNQSFDQMVSMVNKRRQEILSDVEAISMKKKKSFLDQLQLIEAEKGRVNHECEGLESEMEVRHITKKIGDLNERLDATQVLAEPRENAFIQWSHNEQMDPLLSKLMGFGKLKISTTFPALCKVDIGPATTFLRSLVKVTTIDYNGRPRTTGGDPITVTITDPSEDACQFNLCDNENGTYTISFMPVVFGAHQLSITIFDRHLKGSPFEIEFLPNISPISKVGGKGNGLLDFSQPTSITHDAKTGSLYVLDTGNNRIKVLDRDGAFVGHITTDGLVKQGCTGIAMTSMGTIMAINWKTKLITEMDNEGHVLKQFTSPELQQPTCIAVNSQDDVIIADNSAECLFMFDNAGRLIQKLGATDSEINFSIVSGIAVAPNDDIIISDNHLSVYDKHGRFKQEITKVPARGKTLFYSGVTVDRHGNVLATRTERGKSMIEVHRFEDRIKFVIDSHSDKLKRPAGLVTTDDHKVYVCDLGNHSLKKYPYM